MAESMAYSGGDFGEFYERNYRLVYRICYTYMKNQYDAEDCTEDTFVKVLTKNIIFEDEEHEKKWLTVTAINVCRDRLKHWWRKNTVLLEDVGEMAQESGFEPDETLSAVMELPAKYKDVVYLYYYEGYRTEEIAAMLKKNPSTVRNQLRDARIALKKSLGGDF